MRTLTILVLLLVAAPAAPAQVIDLAEWRMVDLTHPLNEHTLTWPTSPAKYRLHPIHYGPTDGGFFYADNSVELPEHGGTHLDAPIHFGEGKQTTDRIPLERLIAPAVVIDVAARAAADPDHRLSAAEVRAFEAEHGRIAPGTIVLLRTGWSARWPDRLAYLGDDTPDDASRLRFPSYGVDAARLLVEERGVAGLGVDAASIDYGRSTDFMVHRIAAERDVFGLENLTRLDELPPTGGVIIALPILIEGGSGGPVRAVALVPRP
jgi:kynurenine formamidase